MEVGSGAPGLTFLQDVELPPPTKKWADVDLNGRVKISSVLPGDTTKVKRSKWREAVKEDLDKLKRRSDPTFSLALCGIACSGALPCVSAKTSYNQFKAVCARVFRKPKYTPEPALWKGLDKFVPLLLPGFEAETMDPDDWLATMPSRRRKILKRAMAKYILEGWKAKYATFSAFVKIEQLPGFGKDASGLTRLDTMVDRLIQGPHDATHCIAGPSLKPLMHRLKEIWDCNSPLFYGGVGPEALHNWLQNTLLGGEGSFFWCDYTMFDCTHSEHSMAFAKRIYRQAIKNPNPDFWKVLAVWERPEGRIGPFRYKGPTMNASGRDDTSLLNGLLNGFVAYTSACAAFLNKDLEDLTVEDVQKCVGLIRMSVAGDDSLGRMPLLPPEALEAFRARMAANIARYGFDAKLKASNKLYDAVYLGMRPYPTQSGWFWGKTIGRAVYKAATVIRDHPTQDHFAKHLGIMDMHVLCSSHVPILSDIAKRVVALSSGRKRTPVRLNPDRPWEWTQKSGVDYDDVTLTAVADIYSACNSTANPLDCHDIQTAKDEILGLIREIREVPTLPYVLDSWVLRRLVFLDEE